ncbi:iron uptake porin [Tumidithrix elongata RA019]|uniref:Iron uptake porin n=1 Tax=Tumidithrix elongata BACA0141 TaxID=2716417 RepID=A0AAW9Q7Z9_9CYAN|nr:iron uptake porin [Tumidithrix elongata RA019]
MNIRYQSKFQLEYKLGNSLLCLGATIVSSTLVVGIAQAKKPPAANKTDSGLIRAIGNDPMTRRPLDQTITVPATSNESVLLQRINQEKISPPSKKTSQNVTSVSHLSDIRPTDWAFTALQSLVERYGCIAGYPDRTYRGNRALSRYEFAVGLNACLDKINEIISAGLTDKVSKEDLATLKKLQEEFASEIATLHGRVDALEAKTTKMEAQQFSTTTKLSGQTVFILNGSIPLTPSSSTPVPATNLTFRGSTQISLLTRFSDNSTLFTSFQASFQSAALTDLHYTFYPVGDRLKIMVGTNGVNAISVFQGTNRIQTEGSGPIALFSQRNPIIGLNAGDAGLGLIWRISRDLSLHGVYSAGNAASASGDGGLFGGPTSIGVQLAATLFDGVGAGLYYLNSYGPLDQFLGIPFSTNVALNFNTNAFGGSLGWRATDKLNFGGWVGFTTSTIQNASFFGSVSTFNWITYVNFLHLFKEGDQAGLSVGQPPNISNSNLSGNINLPNLLRYQVDFFYRYPISKNISITPGVGFVFNSGNTASSGTVTTGTLRTTFSF